jgi:hypothetical protein
MPVHLRRSEKLGIALRVGKEAFHFLIARGSKTVLGFSHG